MKRKRLMTPRQWIRIRGKFPQMQSKAFDRLETREPLPVKKAPQAFVHWPFGWPMF